MRVELNPQFVCVGNQRSGGVLGSRIRVAQTLESRAVGLLNTPGLKSGEGLWLFPCRSIHMRGMQFPIDAVWLDPHGTVVSLSWLTPSNCDFMTEELAFSVLELPSGTIRATDTQIGDRLLIQQVSGL